jgi:hypothetical protein
MGIGTEMSLPAVDGLANLVQHIAQKCLLRLNCLQLLHQVGGYQHSDQLRLKLKGIEDMQESLLARFD